MSFDPKYGILDLVISILQQMFTNNQSKAKQIKSNQLNSANGLKKVRSKDSIRLHDTKCRSQQKQENNKIRVHRQKDQYQANNKSRQKNRHSKIIHHQYYIKQKQPQKQKKINELPVRKSKSKSNSKSIPIDQLQRKEKMPETNQQPCSDRMKKSKRITLPDCGNVITFQGKVIRIAPKINANLHHGQNNYTTLSNSHGLTERQITSCKFEQKIINIRSKQKNHKKTSSKQNLKSKQKGHSKHHKSQQNLPKSYADSNIYKRNILTGIQHQEKRYQLMYQQTQVSPFRQKSYQRPQKFDFQQILELIDQDLQTCKQIKINIEMHPIRKQSIKFMSQVCGQIGVRRQTFYLSISIFDRVISKKINTQNYKLLSLVCLSLAMKLQEAQLSLQFVYVLGIIGSGKQSYLQSISSHQSSSKPNSNVTRNANSTKKNKRNKIYVKQENIRTISTSSIAKILRKYSIIKIPKGQFLQLQQKVTIYLRFRLWRIQAIFWADLLTCLWDQFLITAKKQSNDSTQKGFRHESQPQSQHWLGQNICLLFRCSLSLTNISYLYQLLQMAYNHQNVYSFSSIYIVLSIMYLLIRIVKQSQQNHSRNNSQCGYQYYRQSLASSTNILFVDRTGVNRIFWKFIEKIKVEMVEIISCCQFVSQFLQPSIMRIYSNQQESKDSIDNLLSIHQFNPSLYKNSI